MPDVLTDKQFKAYHKISRYSGIPYYFNAVDKRYQYGTGTNLRTDTPFKIHKVVEGDTLDTLALYYYNNPTYFWIIADYNRIQDPYMTLTVGSQIKIPTFSAIEFEE